MLNNSAKVKLFLLGSLFFIIFSVSNVFASATNGTIDVTYKYAWGENIGWLNFACDNCNAQITDSGISGYAWSKQYGWINLSPNNGGVKNNGTGILYGYAWGSNIGWIDFTGVTINSNGEFLGYATIKSDNSRINFNCINANSCSSADFKVKTDWRRASVRHHGGGGGGYIRPVLPPIVVPNPIIQNPVVSALYNVGGAINSASNFFLNFFRPKNNLPKVIVQVPKIAPLALSAHWDLLPAKEIKSFVFAPLPYEINILASKFPELGNTLKEVGVTRFTDVGKLTGATLNVPGLADTLNKTIQNVGVENLTNINSLNGVTLGVPGVSGINGKMINSVGTGKIALIEGLPLANFSLADKKNLPSEFVFARTAGELVDLNVALSIGDRGQVAQTINTLPGKTLKLVVKPVSKAKSVTGYFIFQAATPRISRAQNQISRASLSASALFSMNGLVEKVPAKTSPPAPLLKGEGGQSSGEVEQKLVLSSFEYTDPNHDGIYTADVVSPSVAGEYQIVTVIDYVDPSLGTRRMTMTTVIDPEGYVFEKNNGKETRIPSAIVSLYKLNTAKKSYELWNAKDYQQENPQITDIRGTYSFLVPEGSYYFQVEAPGYNSYTGKVFVAAAGGGIHQNIELQSGRGWYSDLDWKTVLLIVVFLLLVYNLLKDKLLKFLVK
ncbi:MAG: carboxypeptidase-like regulatory domain-containing protein [Candidatus Pacebacteria bacterium]|nr:carboxypeptidase-like regulatory domain-containing protein [Candidatus Paceibacterota bacterium]